MLYLKGRVGRFQITLLSLICLALLPRLLYLGNTFQSGDNAALAVNVIVNPGTGVVAGWLNANTEPEALIAVHDIGAVGYFTQRPLLDLAGLITPQVVPFIADEKRLLAFMAGRGAEYVVFFSDWSDAYHRMAQDPRLHAVYHSGYEWTRRQGMENMVVFKTEW